MTVADTTPRFVVEDLTGGWFAVLDTRTQLSYDISSSRRRAGREADRRNAAEEAAAARIAALEARIAALEAAR